MFKYLGYIFTLLFIFSVSLEARSLLYKINSRTSTVYVLGSIHLAKPEIYPLSKAITHAYRNSDVLVLELDPTSAESAKSIQESMLSSGMYSANKSLKTELSKKTYNELKKYMTKTGMALEPMQKMRPWIVVLQLSVVEMMRLGYSPELGIDQHFLKQAKQDHKEIVELETAQQQMALLAKDDKSFQDKLLFYTLKDMKELEPMLDDMFRAWKKGDASAFDKIMSKSLEDDASLIEIYDDIIIKRNYAMTSRIEDFLKTKKDYFVVVGSGHVVGKEGIIALLQKAGHKATQY
ncbi:TraB/GumN family protein [Sulfurimonas sp. MAG313]|nr:TraB/GumN family protein [Sulfurimonas sp. MAG313]MDF1880963.1 TraB/GumN family protein [Sulfurimonas sp. MAG313]